MAASAGECRHLPENIGIMQKYSGVYQSTVEINRSYHLYWHLAEYAGVYHMPETAGTYMRLPTFFRVCLLCWSKAGINRSYHLCRYLLEIGCLQNASGSRKELHFLTTLKILKKIQDIFSSAGNK